MRKYVEVSPVDYNFVCIFPEDAILDCTQKNNNEYYITSYLPELTVKSFNEDKIIFQDYLRGDADLSEIKRYLKDCGYLYEDLEDSIKSNCIFSILLWEMCNYLLDLRI